MAGVFKRYDEATSSWIPLVGAPQAHPGLLAIKSYEAASDYSLTSTTAADVDATNLAVTFTVPASGSVLVRLSASYKFPHQQPSYVGVRSGSTTVQMKKLTNHNANIASDVNLQGHFSMPLVVSGLTPGSTLTYKWAYKVGGGTLQLLAGTDDGPAVMEVWDAQTGAGVMVPAQPPLLHVRDEKAASTQGGTFTSGAWQVRTLNTIKTNEITGASLASNEVTLPAGTYEVDSSAGALSVQQHQARLYNVTGTAELVLGTSEYSDTAISQSRSRITGKFTLVSTSVVRLEHRCAVTKTTDGFGVANTWGTNVYADLQIRKIV